jgi:hypothetical protein
MKSRRVLMMIRHVLIFCDRIGHLSRIPVGDRILIIGIVRGPCAVGGTGGNAAVYTVADPTGEVYVVSESGPPREGAFVAVWGTISTTESKRAIVQESRRAGTF